MKERDGNSENDIDLFIEAEYQRYRKSKGMQNRKGKQSAAKENNREEEMTFGKIKQYEKTGEQYQTLLKLLDCKNYNEALLKVDKVNKADKFLERVIELTKSYQSSSDEPTLTDCWRVIKNVVTGRQFRFERSPPHTPHCYTNLNSNNASNSK